MRILVLSKYSRKGASSRYRMFQYYASLEARNHQIRTEPLLEDSYLDRLSSGRGRLFSVIKGYFNRFKVLIQAKGYDVLWIEKELFPWTPWVVEKWLLKRLRTPFIVDYDDAIFHQYDQHQWTWVRKVLGQKCDKVMRAAQCVVAGNRYLGQRAQCAGARNIVIVPTVVSQKVFFPANPQNPVPVIGWIGSKSTASYLEKLRPTLQKLALHYQFKFQVIGATVDWPEFPVEIIPWNEKEESRLVQGLDIGVMPLLDSPWEQGKCGFKLIQYMACGKPVVADPVGVNSEIVQHGVNGYLISESWNWYQALEALLVSADQRLKMGQQSHKMFLQNYSLEKWQDKIYELIESCGHR